jgi:DNA polymerase-1
MTGYTTKDADRFLRDLESTLPRLFEWREEVIAQGRAQGYVTTLAGRERQLPDINSAVWRAMALSERQAVNSKVQGSAADVVRRAMLRAREAVHPEQARQILQVHDEILWERQAGWNDELLDLIKYVCEEQHGFELSVPLSFEPKLADTWAEKEGGPRSPSVDPVEVLA